MKFTSLKNKLRKIWFRASDNKINLSQKSSSLFHWLSLPKFQKNYIVLYDSGWQPYTTIPYITQSTSIKKESMPSYISYDINRNIEIPDSFLPFIKTDILFNKVEENIEAEMLTEFTPSIWEGDYYESFGNQSILIYKGFNDRYFNELYGQTELDEENFLKTHTKKFWEGEIFYSEAGSDFKAVGTIRWIKHQYGIGANDFYTCSPWEDSSFFDRNTYFKSVSGTEITGNMEDNALGGYSIQTVDILDSDTSTHIHGKIFKDIGGNWIQVGINHTIDGSDISSASISFNESTDHSFNDYSGYLLFWSTTNQWIFRIDNNDEPTNLPDITGLPSTSLPYNYFTWKFNPEGYPFRTVGDKQFLSGTQNNVTFKNKTDNYNIKLNGKIYLKQPAVKVQTSHIYEHFDDTYSIDGNTYVKTIENHSEEEKKTYVAESIDVELKFKIIFYNPLQFTQGIKIDGKI